MVLEREILPYLQWLLYGGADTFGALPRFLAVVLGLLLVGLLLGYIVAASRHGLLKGGDLVYRTIANGFREMLDLSPRRLMALSRLAMKEAWRRRVIVALLVFFIVLMFASWFLKTDHQDPAKLYISFVLTATTYLVLGIALILSTFSLPGDFKSKTIYTIVTKPVRAGEIVLGRMIGFTLVGTILLAVMGVVSYIFVHRSLDHTHEVEVGSLIRVDDASGDLIGYDGQTSLDAHHRHDVRLDENREGLALSNFGHHHQVVRRGDRLVVLGAEGIMNARVPQWGQLSFLDQQGVEKPRGISVGSEWTYRSFIAGASQAAAIWTFENVDETLDPDGEGLPIGLIVRVFRTHKGIIGRPIGGTIQVRNPETDLRSELTSFRAVDAKIDERVIDRILPATDGQEYDLFEDFVSSDGKLEIRVQCMEGGQYFGFAQPDLYLRLPDASPTLNFLKVYISIWVQMVIVIAIGVTASTVLSGPVAMLFTVSFIVLGFFRPFFMGVATGTEYGGGPIESLYRLVTQKNVITQLDESIGTTLIQGSDSNVFQVFMLSLAQIVPDFSAFSTVDFAALGFAVPADRVFQDLTVCLAYVVASAIVGYFLFRTREVAR